MTLGHVLKLLRINKGLNQNNMANLLGLSQNYLSLIECDKRRPSSEKIARFADALNVSKEGLLFATSEVPNELSSQDEAKFVELQHNILSLLVFDMTGKVKRIA